MSTTEPVAPPPTRRKPTKATPEQASPTREVVRTEPAPDVSLESVLTGSAQYPKRADTAPRTSYAAFMGLGRPVDPETDLAPGPNRLPRYILAAMLFIKASTGKSLQQIAAEALTGKTPIPAVVLDEAFRELYGYDRPAVS